MAPNLIFPPVVAPATCYTSAFGLLVVSNAALCVQSPGTGFADGCRSLGSTQLS